MSNTFALIALFIVGSADGQCVVGDVLGDSKLCKSATNEVGTCNGATCARSTACDGDTTSTAACGEGNAGRCNSGKCIYTAPVAGKCDLFSATDMLCKTDTNEVGKCNGATCNRLTECDAKADSNTDACGENDAGNCLNKRCTYTAPTVGMCGAFSPTDRLCKSGNYIGMCNGGTCAATPCTGTEPCGGPENDLGTCASSSSKCKYTDAALGSCGVFSMPNDYCKTGTLIGQCDTTTCATMKTTLCQGKADDSSCGHSTEGVLKGECQSQRCIAAKSINVHYIVSVGATEEDALFAKLATESFHTNFGTEILKSGSTLQKMTRACQDEVTEVSNGSYEEDCSPPHFANSKACDLKCDQTNSYYVKTKNTEMCDATGTWVGAAGECAKGCPITDGTLTDGVFTFTAKVAGGGTLTCKNVFPGYTPGSGIGEATQCSVKCPDNKHATAVSRACTGSASPAWTGSPGTCVDSQFIGSSAKLVADPGANLEEITSERNEQFNADFRKAIASQLGGGVLPHHVTIVDISAVAGRRLNENLVQVDYTVQVPKGDPEHATRALRGIR